MQLSSKARKGLAAGLAISTFLWSATLFVAPVVSAAVHSDGCLVLSGGTVWLVTNGTRRGFTSAEVFMSHGYNFSQVVSATTEDNALPVGPIMTYADGTLVKGPSDPLVYLVTGGAKRGFVSGSVFLGLGFSFANVQSAPANTFADLPTGANLESATERHGAGVWVNASGTVWQMTATGRKGVPTMEVFNSYGATFAKVVTANSADLSATNEGLVAARPACSGGSVTPPPPPPVSGMLSVGLASTNPAASTIIQGQAIAHLASFNFSNGSSSEAKVTTLKLKKLGVAADTTLTKVYLYDGENRLTDDASVSSGVITWNNSAGIFTVPGNSSRVISVKSNIAGSTSGQTVGVGVLAAADVATSGPSVTGSFPVNGNVHTIASATLATFDFATSTTPSANTSLDPQEDFAAWQNTVSVGTRAVWLKSMNFRVIGSVESKDLKNFELFIDGVKFGSTVASMDTNGYVLFTGEAKKLETGSRIVKVVADVINGSNRNFYLSLRQAADTNVTDFDFGASILVRGDGSATTNTYAAHDSGTQTVSVGSLTVSKKSDSLSGNVTLNATQVELGRFELKALGERMKVENLRIAVDSSSSSTAIELRNGALFVDGVQVGSTSAIKDINDLTAAYTEYSLGSSLIVEPGTPRVLVVKADIFDEDGTNDLATTQTLIARVAPGSSNVQRMISGGFINVPATGDPKTANTVTIVTGTMTLAKDNAYGNQSVVVPANAYKIGDFTLTNASNTEDININTLQVDLAVADEFAVTDLTNMYVKYGTKTTSLKSSGAATQSWSISDTLAKNSSMDVEIYGDIATAAVVTETAADTIIASLLVSGTTANSGQSVNTNSNAVLAGQTITAKTAGTLTVSVDSGTAVSAQVVAGTMQTDGSLKVKVAATNEDLYVKQVTVRVDLTADDAALASLAMLSSPTSTGTFTQVGTTQTWNNDSTNPGFATFTLTGSDRVKVLKSGSSYLLFKPTYVSSDQGSVSGLTPQLFVSDLQAEGTSVLAAQGAGTDLINTVGIIVQSNTSATFADSTDTVNDATVATADTTFTVTNNVAFTPGDIIFVDLANDDGFFGSEELMVVLIDGGTTLTVQRGAFGTTAVSHATASLIDANKIFRLNNSGTTRGLIGNAMTVLKTKLALSVASDSPSGATTGGTQKVIFKFNASAANNSADPAENKATINWVEITTTESAATVTNLALYPAEFDSNSTYGAACGGVSTTLWRCTLSTSGASNDVVENGSRTYIVRADVGYSGAGSIDASIAALGTSSAAGNDVNWTDGTTAVTWVNQATTTLQGNSQTTTAASGTADTTAPTISTTAGSFAFGGTASNTLVANDTITITFTEEISAATISSSLVPGAAVTPADGATGDVALAITTGVVTVTNIATTDVDGGATAAAATYTTSVALNTAGTVLTITLSSLDSGTGTLAAAEVFGDVTGLTTTITDVSGVALADSAITATGDI